MYFSDPVIFELPVLPRVQKFIHSKLTDEAGQPQALLCAPEALGPGLMLWAMAQPEKLMLFLGYRRASRTYGAEGEVSRPNQLFRMEPTEMTAKIGVAIHEFHPSRHQRLLNFEELWIFSNMVDYMILNEMVQHCKAEPKTSPMVRIKAFCDHYDFSEEDVKESALKQAYLRHRKGVGANGFATQVRSEFLFVPMPQAA